MAKDMEGLQKAENALTEMQKVKIHKTIESAII